VQPEQIKSAGYDGALVYVSELRPGATFDFKPVTREYTDGLRALGLHVVSCYQYGKPGWPRSPSDFTRGYDGGVADATTALKLHGAAGGPDLALIFFSVDEDIDYDTWKTTALQWFLGINAVLGAQRPRPGHKVNACPRPCCFRPRSSPHLTRVPSSMESTSTSTTYSPPTSVNGISLGDLTQVTRQTPLRVRILSRAPAQRLSSDRLRQCSRNERYASHSSHSPDSSPRREATAVIG